MVGLTISYAPPWRLPDCRPFGASRVRLAGGFSVRDGIKRVQAKSSTFRGSHGKWHAHFGRRPYSLDKSAGRAPYDPDSLDFFFIVDGAGQSYLIPSRAVAGRVGILVDNYPEYRVGDAASLLSWDQESAT